MNPEGEVAGETGRLSAEQRRRNRRIAWAMLFVVLLSVVGVALIGSATGDLGRRGWTVLLVGAPCLLYIVHYLASGRSH